MKKTRKFPNTRWSLHKNALPAKIVTIILKQKQQMTKTELAKYLRVSFKQIENALIKLRKRGIMINPVNGGWDKETKSHKEGILVDSTSNKKYFLEVSERYYKVIGPQLQNEFTLLENVWNKYPALREKIEASLEDLQLKFIDNKRNLRILTEKSNGNNQHPNQ